MLRFGSVLLTYNQTTGEQPLCYIPIHEIQAVERVDEEAFGMKFVCDILSTGDDFYCSI